MHTPAVDDAARMLPQGEEFHQTVGSEAAVQIEGRPGEATAARDGEEDADALRNPSGVEDDKEQEDAQQPGNKEDQIVRGQPLELDLTIDALVDSVLCHVRGRRSVRRCRR